MATRAAHDPRIEDYALIGDLQTSAHVGADGSIDWLCLPDFDSPACFAALVGDHDNGHWRIAPDGAGRCTRRRYHDHSMILETEWEVDGGRVRVTDFMPVREKLPNLIRIVEGLEGRVDMVSAVRFRFDYGHVVPWLRHPDGHVVAVAGPDLVMMRTGVDLESEDYATTARFTVGQGDRVPFVMAWRPSHRDEPDAIDPDDALHRTKKFWHTWLEHNSYDGPYFDAVRRSLLVLKSLTYAPTGGIVAAPTASLPEDLGGERNWDYRFCWLRDATFTLQAFLGCGYREEAESWRHWLLRAAAGDPADLQPMYTVAGARRMLEWTVPWLAGFGDSTPVRVGNGAAGQFQLDVWGEVLGGLSLARDNGIKDGEPTWHMQIALAEHLAEHWSEPDDGLWEMRGERQHFVHSKVLAWVGMNAAARGARDRGEDERASAWQAVADTIHDEVCEKGFDAERNTFTQYYGSSELDAATLLMAKVGFLPGDDPRLVGTVDAVREELGSDGFVRRYSTSSGEDGVQGGEGTFLACSFWMVEALVVTGRLDEARRSFESLLDVRNDVGLLAEEWDVDGERQLGNFPQAYSHVGLVNAALAIRDAEAR
ncbi:glycoside hydrolase family 15 protein [Jatrophihabitans endophyticus]|uniref:glycoside hydrolase family 15 protein n=1 Tax=Jatrophihabitans endophyticus TaxID=1206085 RepID=UPI0019FDA1EE|nr:glycoside hydrolase family 15 protein [Jatrophihabitans endophyticus]MBE7188971.1 glycoside hydrolase family 15 protein [Jatrophihabitans endophyticus]